MSKLSNIINFIKDIVSPKYCYSCKIEGHFLCPQCLQKLNSHKPFCYQCKLISDKFDIHKKCSKNVYYDKVIVNFHYREKTIKNLIKDAKFYSRQEVLNDFGKSLSILFLENEIIENRDSYLIISSPMHFLRKLKRGYNHSESLAKVIAKIVDIEANFKVIKKTKHTKQQSKLSKTLREKNLNNCFEINKKYINIIKGKNIIILDDVISTGSTMNEMAKELKEYGAKKVIGLVIASD